MVARTIDFAREAMGARLLGARADGATSWRGASIDSRTLEGGELFVALPGSRVDGHDFAVRALAAGAAAAVVDRAPDGVDLESSDGPWLLVDDALSALHDLTRAVRREVPEHLVSITGSSGKTTTKELLAAMLGRRFRVARTPGNYNNLIGFPLALLSIADDAEWMVAEMGMSTPRELHGVAKLGRPEIAVYTNVRAVHLENFDSVRGIAEAKAEMLEGLTDGGLIVANADDPEVMRIARRHAEAGTARLVTYGLRADDADFRARDVTTLLEAGVDRPGSRFTVVERPVDRLGDEVVERTMDLGVHGLYNVENALAALAAARAAGVDLDQIAEAAASFGAATMRGEVHRLASGALLVDDSYNSNPDAATRALESAARLAPAGSTGRRLAVLGDMLELGPTAETLHREVGREAVRLGFEVVGVGLLAEALVEGARAEGGTEASHLDDAASAAEWLRGQSFGPNDLVLVKGSRGVGLEVAVEALRDRDAHAVETVPAGEAG